MHWGPWPTEHPFLFRRAPTQISACLPLGLCQTLPMPNHREVWKRNSKPIHRWNPTESIHRLHWGRESQECQHQEEHSCCNSNSGAPAKASRWQLWPAMATWAFLPHQRKPNLCIVENQCRKNVWKQRNLHNGCGLGIKIAKSHDVSFWNPCELRM